MRVKAYQKLQTKNTALKQYYAQFNLLTLFNMSLCTLLLELPQNVHEKDRICDYVHPVYVYANPQYDFNFVFDIHKQTYLNFRYIICIIYLQLMPNK